MDQEKLNSYSVSTDPSMLDIDVIHGFLSRSYWAQGIPRETVERCIRHSLCFGVYHGSAQVGFARVISDYTTVAYLADVFIIEAHRGKGLSVMLMNEIIAHPQLQGLRRFILATRDAHGLYERFGFSPLAAPDRWMEIHQPDLYTRNQ